MDTVIDFKPGDVVKLVNNDKGSYHSRLGQDAVVQDPPYSYSSGSPPCLSIRWLDDDKYQQIYHYRFELVKKQLRQATPDHIWKCIDDIARGV